MNWGGISQQRGKSNSKSCKKLCGKVVECHHCGKKGHFKYEFYKMEERERRDMMGKKRYDRKEEMKEVNLRRTLLTLKR